MKIYINKNLNKLLVALSLLFFVGFYSSSHADVYQTGTISFKPININFANIALGLHNKDSHLGTVSRQIYNFGPNGIRTVNINRDVDVYKTPFSMGFHESDRNGYGYGIELGYMVGWDTEVFLRGGFSHEQGVKRIELGERSLDFDDRNNYGLSLGARKYFDVSKSFRPYLGGAAGFTVQGSTKAIVRDHNFLIPTIGDEVAIGKYKFLDRKTLFSFEVHAGTDYVINETWAISLNVALRYGQRGGSNTIITPPGVPPATPPQFGGSLPRPISYSDNRDRWNVPLTLSLKVIL